MKVEIEHDGGCLSLDLPDSPERPTALDALLAAKATVAPSLAFRYGCRAGTCGVCTVSIDGKPRLACRTKLRDGERVGPLRTLPVVRDLVVSRRALTSRTRGVVPSIVGDPGRADATPDQAALAQCIDCYACLSGCPLHEESTEPRPRGNPFVFLKLQQVRRNPDAPASARADALEAARALGLERCRRCPGCRCGVGINLRRTVIAPLLEASARYETP